MVHYLRVFVTLRSDIAKFNCIYHMRIDITLVCEEGIRELRDQEDFLFLCWESVSPHFVSAHLYIHIHLKRKFKSQTA